MNCELHPKTTCVLINYLCIKYLANNDHVDSSSRSFDEKVLYHWHAGKRGLRSLERIQDPRKYRITEGPKGDPASKDPKEDTLTAGP